MKNWVWLHRWAWDRKSSINCWGSRNCILASISTSSKCSSFSCLFYFFLFLYLLLSLNFLLIKLFISKLMIFIFLTSFSFFLQFLSFIYLNLISVPRYFDSRDDKILSIRHLFYLTRRSFDLVLASLFAWFLNVYFDKVHYSFTTLLGFILKRTDWRDTK